MTKIPDGLRIAAEILYRQGYSIVSISEKLELNERTVYNWSENENWAEKYESNTKKLIHAKENIIQIATEQIELLAIATKDGNIFTSKEADMLVKLSKSIQEATAKDEITSVITGINIFTEWLEKEDFEAAQTFAPYMRKFLIFKDGK